MNRRRLLAVLGTTATTGCLRLANDEGTATPGGDGGDSSGGGSSGDGSTDDASGADDGGSGANSNWEYPTGLSRDGVSPLLADKHLNELADTTFRGLWKETNVTRSSVTHYREAHVDEAAALVEWPPGTDITMYSTRMGNYWRQPTGAGATYGRNRGTFDLAHHVRAEIVRRILVAGDWGPPERDPSTDTFVVTADAAADATVLHEEFEARSVESFSAEGRVSDRGIVTRLAVELSFVSRDGERLIEFHIDYEISDVGEVSVSEPDWFATAQERAPEVEAHITDGGQFVEMHHRGGNAILPGTAVVIYDRNRNRNWGYRENRESFEPGTTLYLWMEDDRLRWQRGSRPSAANPQPLDGRYGFWTHRQGAEYFGNVELG